MTELIAAIVLGLILLPITLAWVTGGPKAGALVAGAVLIWLAGVAGVLGFVGAVLWVAVRVFCHTH